MRRPATDQDVNFLREAIRLARVHSVAGRGGPFGAVIVRRGQLIARGWNKVTSGHDPTAHAEVSAIRAACRKLRAFQLRGCVLYASCEPCPMCFAATWWARLDRVVFAADQSDAAGIGFDDAILYREICRPAKRRALRMTQSLQGEAVAMMRAWAATPGRSLY